MRIGFVQFAPVLGDRSETIDRLQSLANQFDGADLLVLPELCNSGYNFVSPQQAWESSESLADSPFVRSLTELCTIHKLQIVAGLNERAGNVLYNSAVLVGPNGVVGLYRKLHLFLDEKEFFQPGDLGLPLFTVNGVRIGMLICYDWMFPECWRSLALKGADIICHPSNLVLPGRAQKAVPVHAMTNRLFVITANRIGSERELTFTGRSLIADPRGELLTEAPTDQECVRIVEIDIAKARDKQITPRNNLIEDRRTDVYGEFGHE